jgi:hypothetical protein
VPEAWLPWLGEAEGDGDLMPEQVVADKMRLVDNPFANTPHCLACRNMDPAAGFSVCSRCANVGTQGAWGSSREERHERLA